MTPGNAVDRPTWPAQELDLMKTFIQFWEDGFLAVTILVYLPSEDIILVMM